MKTNFFLALSCLVAFSSCDDEKPEPATVKPVKRVDVQLNKAQQAVNQNVNQFAFNLFSKISADRKADNLFISPFSVQMDFSMLSNGANGATLDEMIKSLGFEGQQMSDVNDYAKTMTSALMSLDNTTNVGIANSVWVSKSINIKSAFQTTCAESYDAKAASVDFTNGSAQKTINKWSSEKTHGMIDDIAGVLSPNTKMALLNAIYFKGVWTTPFDKSDTKNKPFTCADGIKRSVSMMHLYGEKMAYGTLPQAGFKVLRMPYGNEAFGMTVILPDEGVNLEDCIDKIDADRWNEVENGMSFSTVNVQFPSFELSDDIGLQDYMNALGMKTAFTGGADFSNLSDTPLAVSLAKQKSKIKVDEAGTEAAAVTIIEMKETSIGPSEDYKVNDFIVDRPFAFVISEKSTGAILFIGKINKL